MNRYKITNRENGLKFQYMAEKPRPDQPEWGKDYALVIEDCTYECELQECYTKRMAEYPTAIEWMEAYFDERISGDLTKLQELDNRVVSIKQKYPKPIPPDAPYTIYDRLIAWFLGVPVDKLSILE